MQFWRADTCLEHPNAPNILTHRTATCTPPRPTDSNDKGRRLTRGNRPFLIFQTNRAAIVRPRPYLDADLTMSVRALIDE